MIIITAVGSDRPGMVHALASELARVDCNIEDTTMTRLCGEFAMILVVEPPPSLLLEDLKQRLAPLETSHGLFIDCHPIQEESTSPAADAARYIVSAYGPDKVGLLARLSGVLAAHNVNITDVQTRVASAGAVYVMVFEIEVPPQLAIEELSAALADTAQELGVQVSLHPLEEETL